MISRFQADPDDLLPQIMGFGKGKLPRFYRMSQPHFQAPCSNCKRWKAGHGKFVTPVYTFCSDERAPLVYSMGEKSRGDDREKQTLH